jgi:hypothetical protein
MLRPDVHHLLDGTSIAHLGTVLLPHGGNRVLHPRYRVRH